MLEYWNDEVMRGRWRKEEEMKGLSIRKLGRQEKENAGILE